MPAPAPAAMTATATSCMMPCHRHLNRVGGLIAAGSACPALSRSKSGASSVPGGSFLVALFMTELPSAIGSVATDAKMRRAP
jgi:hypothetical protein